MRNRKRWLWLAGLLVAGALVSSACAGDDGGGDEGNGGGGPITEAPTGADLSVSAAEFTFTPSDLTAPADTPVTIQITNDGTIEHDLTIDEANVKVAVTPAEMGTAEINLPAGVYTFYCSIPGHRAAGMEGTLTVS